MATTHTFTTVEDAWAVLSGHQDRFDSDDAYARACRAVWTAAGFERGCYRISKADADEIIDRQLEEETT